MFPAIFVAGAAHLHVMPLKRATIVSITLVALLAPAFVFDWVSYELDLGNGYTLVKRYRNDVLLRNEKAIFRGKDFPHLEDVSRYYNDEGFLFLETPNTEDNVVREISVIRDGQQTTDLTTERRSAYVVIETKTGFVRGPLSPEVFLSQIKGTELDPNAWIVPQNPNFWRPLVSDFYAFLLVPIVLIGTILFVSFSTFWYVTIPLTVVLSFFAIRLWRKRHNKSPNPDVPDDGAPLT